jgi:hypothetical protein
VPARRTISGRLSIGLGQAIRGTDQPTYGCPQGNADRQEREAQELAERDWNSGGAIHASYGTSVAGSLAMNDAWTFAVMAFTDYN